MTTEQNQINSRSSFYNRRKAARIETPRRKCSPDRIEAINADSGMQ